VKLEEKLFLITNKVDEGHSHISIADQETCQKCPGKYCVHFCPAGVYHWDEAQGRTVVSWENCIECGAARLGCPYGNIIWNYPRGGYGVRYKQG
jgi:ferredoxin like protein